MKAIIRLVVTCAQPSFLKLVVNNTKKKTRTGRTKWTVQKAYNFFSSCTAEEMKNKKRVIEKFRDFIKSNPKENWDFIPSDANDIVAIQKGYKLALEDHNVKHLFNYRDEE